MNFQYSRIYKILEILDIPEYPKFYKNYIYFEISNLE